MYDKFKMKLHYSRRRFDHFSDLPAELKDQIIQYVIPPFRPSVDVGYKHKCHRNSSKQSFRWKLTGIPKDALNLQLVSREVGGIARKRMLMHCDGLDIDYPLQCPCDSFVALKHTEAVYRLRDAFNGMEISSKFTKSLRFLHSFTQIPISLEEWRRILHVNNDLYLSSYTRDWNVKTAIDRMIPIVLEQFLIGMTLTRFGIMLSKITRKQRKAAVALMIELQFRFSSLAIVSQFEQTY